MVDTLSPVLEEVMSKIATIIKDNIHTTHLIVDSSTQRHVRYGSQMGLHL